MNYRNFEIETREIGRGLWHARVSRADHKPTLIDGNEFEYLDVGVAWPSVEAALADAQKFIDLMSRRFELRGLERSTSKRAQAPERFRFFDWFSAVTPQSSEAYHLEVIEPGCAAIVTMRFSALTGSASEYSITPD